MSQIYDKRLYNEMEIQFMEKFSELEESCKIKFGYVTKNGKSAIVSLEKKTGFKQYADQLDYCREFRDLLYHKTKTNNKFAIQPTIGLINFLNTVVEKINNQVRCKDVCISFKDNKILWFEENDEIIPSIKKMLERNITNVPILRDGIIIGIFSENTIFTCLSQDGIVGFDDKQVFADIMTVLKQENHITEKFLFQSPNKLVSQLKGEFEKAIKENLRIGMIFLTDNGKENGKLLGIVTPWDLLGRCDFPV